VNCWVSPIRRTLVAGAIPIELTLARGVTSEFEGVVGADGDRTQAVKPNTKNRALNVSLAVICEFMKTPGWLESQVVLVAGAPRITLSGA
jgi:hypothetical protein